MPEGSYRCGKCERYKHADAFRPYPRNTRRGVFSYCIECERTATFHKTCACCGERYPQHGGRFCSASCEEIHKWERRLAPIAIGTCEGCNTPFARLLDGRYRRYCSDDCWKRTRRKRKRKTDAGLKSNRQNKRRTAESHSDITVTEERRIRRARRCALCSCYLTDKPGPRQRNLDHIIPINVGGTHTHGNVRMLCWTCNRARPLDGSDVTEQPTLWAQDYGVFTSKLEQKRQAKAERARRQLLEAQAREAKREWNTGRALQALNLRRQGWMWQQISDVLGYANTSGSWLAIKQTLGIDPRGIGVDHRRFAVPPTRRAA